MLLEGVLEQLAAVQLAGSVPERADELIWTRTSAGQFSLAMARNLIGVAASQAEEGIWRRIWRFKGPRRASLTLWMILSGGLPTNELLWRGR